MVSAYAHIITGMDTGTPLPYQYGTGADSLAGVSFNAQHLGL